MNTLQHFQTQIHFKADNGTPGGPNNRHGARGDDLEVHVPVGTMIRDLYTQECLADLTEEGATYLAARGGRGGRGNRAFASSRRQGPKIRELGEPGEERWLSLELRLLADVGLVGFPNAGKSSLVSRISRVRPKVAAYPFTTLQPNLGTVEKDGLTFVVADLPGLIEGAHAGRGLGDLFLRHATRARVLVHVIDLAAVEGRDPLSDYFSIREELDGWDELREKPEVVAGNKVDLLEEEGKQEQRQRFRRAGVDIHLVSAVSGEGVDQLLEVVGRCVQETERQTSEPSPPERVTWQLTPDGPSYWIEERDGVLEVWGDAVERLVRRLDLEAPDGLTYLQERLSRMGVLAALERKGVQKGQLVRVGGVEVVFER